MKTIRLFTTLSAQENWINRMREKGYQLTRVRPWLGLYTFQKKAVADIPVTRIDFRNGLTKEAYQEYLTLFSDSGWHKLYGYQSSGYHYFQSTQPSSDSAIFSDQDSRRNLATRYGQYALFLFLIYLPFAISTFQQYLHHYSLLNPQSWYLTPHLWQMEGRSFWFAFLFETPFALGRGLGAYLYGLLALYFIVSAILNFRESKKLQ